MYPGNRDLGTLHPRCYRGRPPRPKGLPTTFGLSRLVALPVAAEIHAGLAVHRQFGDALDLLAVGHAAAIFTPCGLLGVAEEVDAAM